MKQIIQFLSNSLKIFAITMFANALLSSSAFAFDVSPGDIVHLKVTNSSGVPVHERSTSSLIGQVSDDSVVEVVATQKDGRWLEIETEGFSEPVWITTTYVDEVVGTSSRGSSDLEVEPSSPID